MKTVVAVVMFCGATLGLGHAASAAHQAGHKGCVLAGGEATMVTEGMAKYMAEAALKNAIAAHGWKASGNVKITCDAPNGLPHCTARQRACG